MIVLLSQTPLRHGSRHQQSSLGPGRGQGRRRLCLLAPIGLLLLLGAAAGRSPPPALVNESPSLPRGVYIRTGSAPSRGSVVALTPPAPARDFLRSQGAPEKLRLLKRIVALPGDQFCSDGRGLIVPHRSATIAARDRRGRALPSWTGCGTLGADEILVLGDTPGSFDSRYFGPAKMDELEGVFRPLWTW